MKPTRRARRVAEVHRARSSGSGRPVEHPRCLACGKTAYPSRHSATVGAVSVANRNGQRRLTPYECPAQHGAWHLTSR